MFFWSVKKILDHQKRHFGRFWWLITFFCVFTNIDQHNICSSIVFKGKTKENMKKKFVLRFYFKTQKLPFLGVNQFFSVLVFKTIDTQMFFRSVFFKKAYKT